MSLVLVMVRGQVKFFVARVGSTIFGLGLSLDNFPKKSQIFQFFALWVKKNIGWSQKVPGSELGWPLIYCGSKVFSDQGPSLVL